MIIKPKDVDLLCKRGWVIENINSELEPVVFIHRKYKYKLVYTYVRLFETMGWQAVDLRTGFVTDVSLMAVPCASAITVTLRRAGREHRAKSAIMGKA